MAGENVNYSQVLSDVTGKYYVIPRKYNTVYRMTRYFLNQYMHVDDFLNISSAEILLGDCVGDGKVVNLFSFGEIKQNVVKNMKLFKNLGKIRHLHQIMRY